MSKILPVNYEDKHCYDIVINSSFNELPKYINQFNLGSRKVCIITETNVEAFYLSELSSLLSDSFGQVESFVFQAGEASKNLDTIKKLYEFLISKHFDRNDYLLALGGGVVGDMTGFAAATYLRGIEFIQVPTSLLSQVDSSIGGKTGVDFDSYKNMIGAFKQPRLVYINVSSLNSLPKREYLSGMGEIIKHGLIKDTEYLQWIANNKELIKEKDLSILEELIYRSCCIKKKVVEIDPKETIGERALLNFGHTLGHAIEKLMNFSLLHGECVSIGCALALFISKDKGYISQKDFDYSTSILLDFDLPVACPNLDINHIIEVSLLDKKMDSKIIKFILLDRIGNAIIDRTVSKEQMKNALLSLKY